MRVKICGLTDLAQAKAIANLGATDLGFICVSSSPRYITPFNIQTIVRQLPPNLKKIGVFANATPQEIMAVVSMATLTGVQLHGEESPQFCHDFKILMPQVELIKAIRIKDAEALATVKLYENYVDVLLLDAYHPQMLGGSGKTINWDLLTGFAPNVPWLLAGGVTPDNVLQALTHIKPSGIDLSSGVERSPGHQDLDKVALLFANLKNASREVT